MIGLAFGFVVVMMIGAGILILKLAEISKSERGKKSWIWGVVILIALIVVPILVLGIVIRMVQYGEIGEAFKSFGF